LISLATVALLSELGAEVISVGRSDKATSELPNDVSYKQCDVLDKTAVKALFSDTGSIDILISTATGGTRAVGPFNEMDMDGYQGSFAKLWGYTNVVRAR